MKLRIVSWNILQGGGKRIDAICESIRQLAPDMLVLQEYRNGKGSPSILDCLDKLGLDYRHIPDTDARKNAVLLASRYPFNCAHWDVSLDSSLAVEAQIDTGSMTLHLLAGHFPHKKAQVPYFDAILARRVLLDQAALILGDLNCGIPFEDSDTNTFSNTHLFQALLKQGWIDSWRSRHKKVREFSWISPRGNGFRYDHCLSSRDLDRLISKIGYEHQVRESGVSDHSAIIVEVDTDKF